MKKLLLIITAFLILISCSNDKNNESQKSDSFFSSNHYGGILNEGTTTLFTGFLPYVSKGESSERAISLIYSSLFKYNDENNLIPDIIEDYKIDNNDFIFSIKKNIYWHNDEKLTIEDVLVSLKIAKEKYIIPSDTDFEILENNKIIIYFNNKINLEALAKIIILPKKFINEEKYNLSRLIYMPIGTGPYKLTENENNMIKLNVNDKYFDKRANIDEYNIYIFKTKKALLNAVKTKKIDFIFDIDIDIPDLEKLEFDTGNRQILIFNARSRFFSNIVYRKKFIDSVKNIFNNNDYTIYKESPDIKYDCLSEIKDKKIKKTSLRLLISENNEFLYKMAKDISNYWSKKGIIIKIIKKPPSEILYFMKRGLKSDFVLIDWQNFSNTSFKNFFKNEKNIFNINSSLDKEVDFLREIFCNYHSYIISKSISYIYFNKKIKNIKFKKNKLNNPIYWYISE